MFLLVKLAAESGVHVLEIAFWRQAVAPLPLLVWLWSNGSLGQLRTQRFSRHFARAVIGNSNMIILFFAATLLPLAESITLGFTTPLFAVIIAAMVLGERIGPWRWAAVLAGFAGILVITQPGTELVHPLGTSLALFAAVLVAIINFQIRDLGRTESSVSIVFYFGLLGATMTGIAMPFVMTAHSAHEWLLLLTMGAMGTIAQLLMTTSLRMAGVASVIIMDYSSLIWATLLGWLAWNQLPSASTWLGAPLIIGAGLLIAWREHRLARNPSPVTAAALD
jgi:drug/metabolite transporter (DMT)-like permease